MSDHIDTRDGWRKVDDLNDFTQSDRTGRALVEYDGPVVTHVWVREAPVPPLPNAPGYYVSGEGAEYPGGVYRLDEDGEGLIWDDTYGNPHSDDEIRRALPLSPLEPRAVTAKAVLDRVRAQGPAMAELADHLAHEFGVES